VLASGQSKRIKLPREEWIKIPVHHPAYLSVRDQEEIKSILQKNQFKRRYRVGKGRALTQGLLRCSVCNATLLVSYTRRGQSFMCRRSREYAEKPCIRFDSNDLDESILREVFKVLKTPPIEILKAALDASRIKHQTRQEWIRSERERLAHEEMVAQERADLCRGRFPEVHFAALQRLEKILQEKRLFEQKLALEPVPLSDESEAELEELCRVASDIPSLWHHEAVTHTDRKEIIRCLIDCIVVAASRERLDAKIFWKSGANTPVSIWRARSRHHLIRELHAQQLTASEIKEHLAAGKTSTGQRVDLTEGRIRAHLQRMGLKPAKYSASRLAVRRRVAELHAEGRSFPCIAEYLNEQGIESPSGKSWTHFMVQNLTRKSPNTNRTTRFTKIQSRIAAAASGTMADDFKGRLPVDGEESGGAVERS
jgi:hypothetical protein